MNKQTLILGNGPCACAVAENLLTTGAGIVIATRDKTCDFDQSVDSGVAEILTELRLISCKGFVGNFRIEATQNNKTITIDVGRIIIAEEDQRKSNFALYGLKASSNIVTLSQMKNVLLDSSNEKSILSEAKTIGFLAGLVKESHPVVAEEIMHLALNLQSGFNVQTYILTKNLKVAGNGLEALYRKTKNAGAVYIKFTDVMPDIYQKIDKNIRIEFIDEITSKKFRLSPDITVVDETIVPSDCSVELAEIFKLDADPHGFVQTDNVHRYCVLTNRKGIMAVGPSRSIQNRGDQIKDAENAALTSAVLIKDQHPTPADKAEIDTGQCVRCLTCYRLCPYHAITVTTRVTVVADACERCGICTAQCPRGAVSIKDLEPGPVLDEIKVGKPIQIEKAFTPSIVAFCCSRSSAQAGDLALCMGHNLPLRLKIIEVPCAGSISWDHIFTAFRNHADGVLVATCHKGNCHSEWGNIFAEQTVLQIKDVFSQIGFEKDRLLIQTLASNMGTEFAEMVSRFEETIVELGPSRLNPNVA